jgi:nucleotide-binding universal stress UspA family protein
MVAGGVRPIVAVSERFRAIRRVLIAYGGSVREAEAMKQFVQLRPWSDVNFRILVCGSRDKEAERLSNDAFLYCRQHGYEPELNYRSGSAEKAILAEANEWDADLIVLGVSQGNALSRAIFGTTALHVIRNVDRPLFLG